MATRNKELKNNPRDYDDEGSRSEVNAFKKGLLDVSLETIRDRLAGKSITRKWKRDLVEAELARREEDDPEDDAGMDEPSKPKTGRRNGRWAAAAIIGVCILIILYTAIQLWLR